MYAKFCRLFVLVLRSTGNPTSLKTRCAPPHCPSSHSYLLFQFRVQDTCYELMFRIAAFGLEKKTASQFISQLRLNSILEGSVDWPHAFLPSHRREHKRQIPNATTVKWTCNHLVKHLHLLKITLHALGQLGLLQVEPRFCPSDCICNVLPGPRHVAESF